MVHRALGSKRRPANCSEAHSQRPRQQPKSHVSSHPQSRRVNPARAMQGSQRNVTLAPHLSRMQQPAPAVVPPRPPPRLSAAAAPAPPSARATGASRRRCQPPTRTAAYRARASPGPHPTALEAAGAAQKRHSTVTSAPLRRRSLARLCGTAAARTVAVGRATTSKRWCSCGVLMTAPRHAPQQLRSGGWRAGALCCGHRARTLCLVLLPRHLVQLLRAVARGMHMFEPSSCAKEFGRRSAASASACGAPQRCGGRSPSSPPACVALEGR
jgi:hypothetical protein